MSLQGPIEFHCTLPVQPSRAQQILYGSTLADFVCGEQIARALVTKAKCTPKVTFADTPAVLSLRHICSIPVASVECTHANVAIPFPDFDRQGLSHFEVNGLSFSVLEAYSDDAATFRDCVRNMSSHLDLLEPFGRIEEALLEAHPVSKAA